MAYDVFLILDGVKGESTDAEMSKKHAMEINALSWGLSNPTTVGSTATGSGGGKVSMQGFSISKRLEAASVNVVKNCCIGDHFKTGEIIFRKAGGTQMIYLQYDLTEVYVDNYSISGAVGGDDMPNESISFTFAKVTMSYWPQKSDGKQGTKVTAGWDLTINKVS